MHPASMRQLYRLAPPLRTAALRFPQPRVSPPFNPIAIPSALRFQAAIRNQASAAPYSSSSTSSTIEEAPKPSSSPKPALPHKPAPHRNPDEPIYQLTFTCKACQHRSSHTISKQGYHKGTVLITCPGCKNRHLISDHLHIFSDTKVTLEDIMRQKGEDVQRGSITPDGDVEFWEKDATPFNEQPSGEKES